MAVNVPNPGLYQQQLGNHVTAFRNALQTLINDAAYLNAMGGAAFLTSAMGISADDATAIVNSIGGVTPGNATVQALNNWISGTQFLWGGN